MAADKGCVLVMKGYGVLVMSGEGIEVDMKKAARYLKMAADAGDAVLMHHYMIAKMKESEQAIRESVAFIKSEAEKGNPIAMYLYGVMLDEGDGVEVDKKEAICYIKMAANKGNAKSLQKYNNIIAIEKNEA